LGLKVASLLLDQFPDGVFLVSLAPLDDPELVILALAQALDLSLQRNRSVMENVQNYLRDKHMLLLVDNFDHLMAAAPLVSELLAHCSHLRMLVASRELLNVQGEHIYPVAPLSLPTQAQLSSLVGAAELSAIAAAAAVQLFVQRAQAIMPGFVLDESNAEDVAAICVHLDGLPLAIELVVARIRLLPPRVLRQRLLGSTDSPFALLQGGMRDAPARHHTLKDAIGWSYKLLTVAEQRLFRLFSAFAGGCTFDAVERISELAGEENHHSVLELLSSLINKSLLRQAVQPNGEMRFSMLEMIREYALEQAKAAGDFDQANRAHAETFALFAEAANAALSSPDDLAWIARLNSEQDNCRTALQWALTNQDNELAMRLGDALWTFWVDRGYYLEGRQFLQAILQLDGAANRTPWRMGISARLARFWMRQYLFAGNVETYAVLLPHWSELLRVVILNLLSTSQSIMTILSKPSPYMKSWVIRSA
jgi:predicted ATPase